MTGSALELEVKSGSKSAKISSAPIVSSYPSTTSAILTFSPPSDNGGYYIKNFNVYVNNNLNLTLNPIGPHSFTISPLVDGTSYKVEISSENEIAESEKSDALIFTFEVPYTPATLALTSTQTQINLAWTQPSSGSVASVDGYKIYINDGEGAEPIFVYSTEGSPSVLSHSLTQDGSMNLLECGKTYRVQVTSINEVTESTPIEQSIIVGQTPGAPINLRVTESIPTTSIKIEWNHTEDTGCLPLRSYILTVNGVDQTSLTITGDTTIITYDISSGGAIGTIYTLSLRAVNDKSEGLASDSISVTVGSVPNSPSALTLVSRPSQSSIVVSWTPDTAITNNIETNEYRIYRQKSDGTEQLLSTSTKSSNYQVTLPQATTQNPNPSGLTTGDSYSLIVRAANYWGESGDSNILIVIIGTKPSQPPIPTLTASTSTSLSLKINPSISNGGLPIISYIVSYDVAQSGSFVNETISDLSNLVWSKTGLTTSALVDIEGVLY